MKYILIASLGILMVKNLKAQEDPYIWMEEVESERSMEWVKNQNVRTSDKLKTVQGFEALKNDFLESMNDDDKIDYPSVVGDMVYNFLKDENHVRGIWRRTSKESYMADKAEWETVLDLDELSEKEGKKWVFQGADWLAPGYTICLLHLSDGGTDEHEVREFDASTKRFVEGGFNLPSSKGSASWISEDEILIARDFGEGSLTTSGYPCIVKRLKRGQKMSDAEIIMKGDENLMGIWPGSSYIDGKYLLSIYKAHSFYNHDVYYIEDGKPRLVNVPSDSEIQDIYQNKLLLRLNSDWKLEDNTFKQGDLVAVDQKTLFNEAPKTELIYRPNAKSSIEGVFVTKDRILLNLIQNVVGELHSVTYTSDGWSVNKMETPEFGQISVIEGSREEKGFFYEYSGYVTPPTVYYQEGDKATIVRQSKAKFNADNLEVHQYEAKSADGTMIPYFIVHAKGIELNGENPTLVYAYGGFNVSIKPGYNTRTGIGWLQQGGVYVVANIRGGGEFGPAWHQGAMKEKRQNAYNDFYAVCEDLIDRKITTPRHMGAFGWSNGGLMAGVVATQRPDLFNAVIIGAPLLDMKRFNKMLAGASWMGEYGNPDTDDWKYIKKFSPYHNVFADKKYPEVFFITSTKDDRVHPAHARKMAARMMEQGHPIFYYETVEGGHGASSTNDQAAFNQAMMFSYLRMKLN